MKRPVQVALFSASGFDAKAKDLWLSMRGRFAEKRDKRGNIKQVGRPLPFTAAELADHLRKQLGKESAAVRCPYRCGAVIDIANLALDHVTPASLGGSLELSNLIGCCARCNKIKSNMTGPEFVRLREFVEFNLSQSAANELWQRLEFGGFLKQGFFHKGRKDGRRH